MISVSEATKIVHKHLVDIKVERVPIEKSIGRILAEKIVADRDFPPFNRVMMDGIAINFEAWESGQKSFKIAATAHAGEPQINLENKSEAIEVMTGCILPANSNVVIPYEDIELKSSIAKLKIDQIREFQNIHGQGVDRIKDDLLIEPGISISAAEVGIFATVGKREVYVKKLPKVAVVSSGDELVEVNEQPLTHQIRKSNVYSILASLNNIGIEGSLYHVVDERDEMRDKIQSILKDHDVLILSGGVSKGKKDYMPEILDELGVIKLFHRVKQRPGKPFWFGWTRSNKHVFAFPGNPVSTFLCFYRYFLPWLNASMSNENKALTATIDQDFSFDKDLTYFLQVSTYSEEGRVLASPVKGKGSGDLANLLMADAFLELPANQTSFKKGDSFPLIRYRLR